MPYSKRSAFGVTLIEMPSLSCTLAAVSSVVATLYRVPEKLLRSGRQMPKGDGSRNFAELRGLQEMGLWCFRQLLSKKPASAEFSYIFL